MKFRMLLSALLLAAGLVCVTGCGKKAAAKAGDKAAAKSETPTAVVNKANELMKQLNFAEVVPLCDGQMKTDMERAAKQFAELKAKADKGDATAKQIIAMQKEAFEKRKFEVKSEKIDGDFAELITNVTDGDGKTQEVKGHLKKVNGEWKLISDSDYKKANK